MQLKGLVQLKLFNFVNNTPGFSKFSLSFLQYPEILFDITFKKRKLKLNTLPVISNMIHKLLKKSVWRVMVYPRSITININKTKLNLKRNVGSLVIDGKSYREVEGYVKVKILKLELREDCWFNNILNVTGETMVDWYCTVFSKGDKLIYNTDPIKADVWRKKFRWEQFVTLKNFTIGQTRKYGHVVNIELWVSSKRHKFLIGQISIDLMPLISQERFWYNILDEKMYQFSSDDVSFDIIGLASIKIEYKPPKKLKLPKYLSTTTIPNKIDRIRRAAFKTK
ncbi:hypothetical protein MHBO_001435 [Bonamia ostreae]|uniref:Uncharacterized protein n=1 Tax=Bonamia ostreae TaxID=126728 RepID=A0ABV2AIZ7_9EUKA